MCVACLRQKSLVAGGNASRIFRGEDRAGDELMEYCRLVLSESIDRPAWWIYHSPVGLPILEKKNVTKNKQKRAGKKKKTPPKCFAMMFSCRALHAIAKQSI